MMSEMTMLGRSVSKKPFEIHESEIQEFESMKTKPESWDMTIEEKDWSGEGIKLQVRA